MGVPRPRAIGPLGQLMKRGSRERILPAMQDRWSRLVVCVLLTGLHGQACAGQTNASPSQSGVRLEVGRQEWLFTRTQELVYGLRDYSVAPVTVIRRGGRLYAWIAVQPVQDQDAQSVSCRFSGQTLTSLIPDPDQDGHAVAVTLAGAARMPSVLTLFAAAETAPLHAWYQDGDTVNVAVSEDDGRSFQRTGPSSLPGNPGSASKMKAGDWVGWYYTSDRQRIGLMRLDPKSPASLAKQGHTGSLLDPPVEGQDPWVSYNTALGVYLMVHMNQDAGRIVLRTSTDGLRWSPPQSLVEHELPASGRFPSLVDDGQDPSVTDQEFWLLYSHSTAPAEGHRLVRRRIRLAPPVR